MTTQANEQATEQVRKQSGVQSGVQTGEHSRHAPQSDATPIIDTTDLWRIYKLGSQEISALRGIDMTIGSGEFLALKGRSGSGKTTLLNCVGGLDSPSKGNVRIFGEEIGGWSERKLTKWRRQHVGFLVGAPQTVVEHAPEISAHLDRRPLAAQHEARAERQHPADELHRQHPAPAQGSHAVERSLDFLDAASGSLGSDAPNQEHRDAEHDRRQHRGDEPDQRPGRVEDVDELRSTGRHEIEEPAEDAANEAGERADDQRAEERGQHLALRVEEAAQPSRGEIPRGVRCYANRSAPRS